MHLVRADTHQIYVLISTYWNVNIRIGDIGTTADAVLISTYWNVNF